MAQLYVRLDYEEYKAVEEQMKAFSETVHESVKGNYHKSIRIRVAEDLLIEFHGPLVAAGTPELPGMG